MVGDFPPPLEYMVGTVAPPFTLRPKPESGVVFEAGASRPRRFGVQQPVPPPWVPKAGVDSNVIRKLKGFTAATTRACLR